MSEDQRSVCLWAYETFGPRTAPAAVRRMMAEVQELHVKFMEWHAVAESYDLPETRLQIEQELVSECADVVITMFAAVDALGFDLQRSIDEKMAVNRKRRWKSHGDGTGQHEE